jgi:hypothetical protein
MYWRSIIAILAMVFAIAPGSADENTFLSPWPQLPPSNSVPIGVNLEGLADWMRAPMYVDAMKTSRPFGDPAQPWSGSSKIKLDSNGCPEQDAGCVIISGLPHMGGTYRFSCKGRTQITPIASDATVTNVHYDEGDDDTKADIVVGQTATQLMLSFTHTTGGIANIKLIRPGYAATTKQVFTNEFLNALQPFTVLRFMDFSNTNGSTTLSWEDRPLTADEQYTSGKGGPWEDAILLANLTHKDIWANIPEEADDNYIRKMAQLFKAKLNPGRVVYLENSNEVWNSSFPQFSENQQQAEVEAKDPKSSLRVDTGVQFDDPNNKWYWGTKRVAERLIKISKIWQSVYGATALNKTIRPVLASQISYPFLIKLQVGYIAKVYGPPNQFIYAIAGAPYFGLDDQTINNANDTVDDVIGSLRKAVDVDTNNTDLPFIAIAKQYDVKCLAYEGGPDIGQRDQSVDAKIAANRDPRMTDLLVDYLNGWYGDGGGLFMYFDLTSAYNKWGCWGLMDDIAQPTAKTKAIVKVIGGRT